MRTMTIRRIRMSLENVLNQSFHYYSKQASGKSKSGGNPGENFYTCLSKMLITHLRGEFGLREELLS